MPVRQAGLPPGAVEATTVAKRFHHSECRPGRTQGFMNLSTNSSFGWGGSGVFLSSGIVRIAQEIALFDQLESGRFDFLLKKRLFDPMQSAGFGDAGTRSTRMVSYDVKASRPERAKDCFVHGRAIDAEVSQVVVVEHQGHEIEAFWRKLGWNGVFKRSGERNDGCGLDAVASEIVITIGEGDRGRAWCACRRCRRRARRGGRVTVALWCDAGRRGLIGVTRPALTVNFTRGPDCPSKQLGGVATARTEIELRRYPDECR